MLFYVNYWANDIMTPSHFGSIHYHSDTTKPKRVYFLTHSVIFAKKTEDKINYKKNQEFK